MRVLQGASLDSVEKSLEEVLTEAGLAARVSAASLALDFSHLDTGRVRPTDRQLLETSASLLLQLQGHARAVTAVIPNKPTAQQILADSGLMFALANVNAHLALNDDEPSTSGGLDLRLQQQESLFDDSPYRRLLRARSWREDFSPHSTDLRQLLLGALRGDDRDRFKLDKVLNRAHLGVVGRTFLGLVNPHYLPNADAVASVTTTASPWLRGIVGRRMRGDEVAVDDVLRILTEAFENVMQHAWPSNVGTRRSLITISQVGRGPNVALRLQILDNGIGIPTSIDRDRREQLTLDRAQNLVDRAFTDDGLFLPNARGFGLPRIRQLVERLDGTLRVTTAGPGHTQIVYSAAGEGPAAVSTRARPVSGTVIAVHLPFAAGDRSSTANQ